MSEERKKILEMLAGGKISAADAERLLDKLGTAVAEDAAGSAGNEKAGTPASTPRFLRIEVEKPGQEKVNLRVPLSFARTGSRLMAVLPARISERLAEFGIDASAFAAMGEQDWAEAIRSADVDVCKGNGKRVRIFCE